MVYSPEDGYPSKYKPGPTCPFMRRTPLTVRNATNQPTAGTILVRLVLGAGVVVSGVRRINEVNPRRARPVRAENSMGGKHKGIPQFWGEKLSEKNLWGRGLRIVLSANRQFAADNDHKPTSRLPLLAVRPAVTFPASERHRHRPAPLLVVKRK